MTKYRIIPSTQLIFTNQLDNVTIVPFANQFETITKYLSIHLMKHLIGYFKKSPTGSQTYQVHGKVSSTKNHLTLTNICFLKTINDSFCLPPRTVILMLFLQYTTFVVYIVASWLMLVSHPMDTSSVFNPFCKIQENTVIQSRSSRVKAVNPIQSG